MKTLIIIQARMNSTRLPGKVLKKVLKKPLLQYQIERLKNIGSVDELVVATTTNTIDDEIVDLCQKLGCSFFRGPEKDVLLRYSMAAKEFNGDCIVRINSDCPIIDPKVVLRVLSFYHKHFKIYDYVSNILEKGYPIGFHTEVFSTDALEKAQKLSSDKAEREHVTPYIYRNPKLFRIASIAPKNDMSNFRCTIDYIEDLSVVTKIIEALYPINPDFGLKEIVAFMKKHPEIDELNSFIFKEQTI